jgi:hypothetical protein
MTEFEATVKTKGTAAGVLVGFAFAALLGVAQANERGDIGVSAPPKDIDRGLETATDTEDRLNEFVSAEEPDTALSLRPEGGELIFEFKETTRYRVVQYLLAKSGAAIRWANRAHATELISGRYSGSLREIVRRLLSRSNYVIAYDTSGGRQRIARVLVLGPVLPSRASVRAIVPAERQLRDQEQQVLQRLEAAREAAERLRRSRGR